MAKRGNYTSIDLHGGAAWPPVIPELTAYEAERAVRRLWRFSTGKLWEGQVKITSGNRAAMRIGWEGNSRCMWLNPSQGWKDLVHYLSHIADRWVNGDTVHGPHHARFEAKLIREVIKRGYLEGKLQRTYQSYEGSTLAGPTIAELVEMKALPPIDAKQHARAEKLKRVEARLVIWRRKLSRAQNAIAKLERSQRGLVRHLP